VFWQFFVDFVFKLEQSQYIEEGIEWENVMFKDNASCLATIEGKQGVLSVLDEICILPQGTDERFSAKVRRSFTLLNAVQLKFICFRCGHELIRCFWIHSTQPEPLDSIIWFLNHIKTLDLFLTWFDLAFSNVFTFTRK